MTKDDEAYSTREAIACSAFGRHLAEVYPDRAEKLINDTAFGMGLAVESSMRVEITEDIIEAYRDARAALNYEQLHGRPATLADTLVTAGLTAAFRAAGFEVVT